MSLIVDEIRRQRRLGRGLVRRELEGLHRLGLRLHRGGERPVVELLRLLLVAGAVDDRHRADLVAGALAGRDRDDREAGGGLGHGIVEEDDADRRLAEAGGLDRRRAGLGVLVDVGVEGLEVGEGLLLAHELHERREHGVGGARGVGVRDLDLALVLGLDEVGPALGLGQAGLGEQVRVVAEAEGAGIDADGALAAGFGLPDRPVVEFAREGALVDFGQFSCAAWRCGSPVPAHHTSPLGLSASALTCA